jgi:hypothetical protein
VYDCTEILQILPLLKAVEQLDQGVASMGRGTLLMYQENDMAWEGSRDGKRMKRNKKGGIFGQLRLLREER